MKINWVETKIVKNILQNLKYLRKKNHVSQQILANTIGVGRSTLGDYETGRYEPLPVLRKQIPKRDGQLRPLGVPLLLQPLNSQQCEGKTCTGKEQRCL